MAKAKKRPGIDEILLIADGEVSLTVLDHPLIVDDEAWKTVRDSIASYGNDIPIDWEHSTEKLAADKAERAPAAGWVVADSIRYEKGRGIVGDVKWTEQGMADVKGGQYRYLSPVAKYDKETHRVTGLKSIALTNQPATRNQVEILQASIAAGDTSLKDNEAIAVCSYSDVGYMNPGQKASGIYFSIGSAINAQCELLRSMDIELPENATPLMIVEAGNAALAEIVARIQEYTASIAPNEDTAMADKTATASDTKAKPEAPDLSKVAKALGLDEGADEATVIARAGQLSAGVGTVSAKDYAAMEARVKAIEAAERETNAERVVQASVNANKLNPRDEKQMAWARATARENPEFYKNWDAAAPAIIPNGQTSYSFSAVADDTQSRKTVIASAQREYASDPVLKRYSSLEAHVNTALLQAREQRLTNKEIEALSV